MKFELSRITFVRHVFRTLCHEFTFSVKLVSEYILDLLKSDENCEGGGRKLSAESIA